MGQSRLSIVIPIRNRSGLGEPESIFGNCVLSLYKAVAPKLGGGIDVIVVDYGSEPEHSVCIQTLCTASGFDYIPVRSGFRPWRISLPMNVGLHVAQGLYVCFLNAEFLVRFDWLDQFWDEIDSDKPYKCVATPYVGMPKGHTPPSELMPPGDEGAWKKEWDRGGRETIPRFHPIVVPTGWLREMGGIQNHSFSYGMEDWDLWMKARSWLRCIILEDDPDGGFSVHQYHHKGHAHCDHFKGETRMNYWLFSQMHQVKDIRPEDTVLGNPRGVSYSFVPITEDGYAPPPPEES